MSVAPPQPYYPQAPPPTPGTYALPPPPYGWYYPPPKSDDSKLVILIVVIVLLVILVPIVFGAMLYFMVSGLIENPDPAGPPTVTMTPAESCGADCVDVGIADVSPVSPQELFRVNLLVAGTVHTADVAPGLMLNESGIRVTFTDFGGDPLLTTGDSFRIEGVAGGGTCALGLVWAPVGVQVVRVEWIC